MKNKRVLAFRGSFTIEASLLLPLIVFLIWNVLYLTFFLYDQSTILQGCYCTALRTERMVCGTEEKENEAAEKFDLSVTKKAVAADIVQKISAGNKDVTVEAEITMKAPAGYFFQSIWSGQQRETAEAWEPVAFIRKCRKAENIWNMIKMRT